MAKELKKLVIVESPAKARKIGGYLGDDYIVEASVGHIRDLPQKAADIPKEYKKIAWAKEGVNIEEGFEPLYVINPDKKAKVSELKALMKDADELILATDEDREGEAIASPSRSSSVARINSSASFISALSSETFAFLSGLIT